MSPDPIAAPNTQSRPAEKCVPAIAFDDERLSQVQKSTLEKLSDVIVTAIVEGKRVQMAAIHSSAPRNSVTMRLD